ncbi:MAG: hypothetical protein AAF901_08050, partial [Bacteroidota bacterium]
KSGTLAIAFGGTYNLGKLLEGLSAGLRFYTDISNINDEDVDAGNLRSNMFQVNILYTIPNSSK